MEIYEDHGNGKMEISIWNQIYPHWALTKTAAYFNTACACERFFINLPIILIANSASLQVHTYHI